MRETDPDDATSAPPPTSGSVEAEKLSDFLLADGRVGLIIGPRLSGKTYLLNEAAAAFGGAVFKVANPLAAPLTLTRIIVQVDVTDDGDDDALLLRAHLADHAKLDLPALLAIDDAHTLDDEALAALAGIASYAYNGPGVRLLLAGSPDLERRLVLPGLEALNDPLSVVTFALPGRRGVLPAQPEGPRLPHPTILPAVPPPPPPMTASVVALVSESTSPSRDLVVPTDRLPPRDGAASDTFIPDLSASPHRAAPAVAVRKADKRRNRLMIPLLVVGALVGAVGVGLFHEGDRATAPTRLPGNAEGTLVPAEPLSSASVPAVRSAPAPSSEPTLQAAPEAAAGPRPTPTLAPKITPETTPEASPAPAPPPLETVAPRPLSKSEDQLRLEFQAFLTRSGRSALANDPSKFEALFQDYIRWRSKAQLDERFPVPR